MLRNAMLMPIFLQKSFYHPVFQFEFREAKSASQSHTDSGGGGLVAKSCLTLTTPQALAHQAPLLMGFSRQGCWTGLPFIPPGDLPNPGIKARSPALQADSLLTAMGKPYRLWCTSLCLWHSCSCLLCYPSVGFLLPKRSNTVPQAGGTAYSPPPPPALNQYLLLIHYRESWQEPWQETCYLLVKVDMLSLPCAEESDHCP